MYPRLAGQHPFFLKRSFKSFQKKERINIPMYPYTQSHEVTPQDIADVAAYLASLKIYVSIPPHEGYAREGRGLYKDECSRCHGPEGRGKLKSSEKSVKFGPAIAGQYPQYLKRQIMEFKSGRRPNETDMTEAVEELTEEDIDDILAHVITLERHPGMSKANALKMMERIGKMMESLTKNTMGKEPIKVMEPEDEMDDEDDWK